MHHPNLRRAGRAAFFVLLPAVASSAGGGEVSGVYGRVEQCPIGTLRFVSDDGARLALGEVAAQPGDYIRVSGEIHPNSASACGQFTFLPRLIVSELQQAFAGCATLDLAGPAPTIVTGDGRTLLLAEAGAFADGEIVFVRGVVADVGEPMQMLQNGVIAACGSAIGRIESVAACAEIRTSDGALTTVSRVSDFGPGEFVVIEGAAAAAPSAAGGGCAASILDNVTGPAFGGVGTAFAPDACGRNFSPEPTAGFQPIRVRDLSTPAGGERFVLGSRRPLPLICDAAEVDEVEELTAVRRFGELVGPTAGGWLFSGDDGFDYLLEGVTNPPFSATTYVSGALPGAVVAAASGVGTGFGASAGAAGPIVVRFARVHAVLDSEFYVGVGFECTPLGRADDSTYWTLMNFGAATDRRYHLRGIAMTACPDLCPYPCLHVTEIGPATTIPADLNCDGAVTVSDISPFVLALTDPAAYAASYPFCDVDAADVNNDGNVSVSDIGVFVLILTGEA